MNNSSLKLSETETRSKPTNKIIENLIRESKIHTSTPYNTKSMNFLCTDLSGGSLQGVDNDSGYVSHNQESNSEIPQTAASSEPKTSESVYINEDALLEKPESITKAKITEEMYEEYSHLYYLNSSIVYDSISPVKSAVSAEKSSDDTSPDLQLVAPIIVRNEHLDNFINNEASCSRNEETVKNISKITTPKKRKRSLSTTPRKEVTPKKGIVNRFSGEKSPDLFSDDECAIGSTIKQETVEEKYISKCDKKVLKKLTKTLGGVPPPPSLTTTYITVNEMLEKIHSNEEYFWHKNDVPKNSSSTSNYDDISEVKWPDILEKRNHNLNYNRSNVSEEIESLYMKYAERYIGAETQSSCTAFELNMSSPLKRRVNRMRGLTKSPGRRLSHLARRRITFSSSNLHSVGSSNTHARRILIDAKRYELLSRRPSPRKCKSPRKTPRKTPRKSPRKTPRKLKTPTSSVRKSLAFKVYSGDDAEPSTSSASSIRASATKRALFQSPDKNVQRVLKATPSTKNPTLSPWKKRNTPKRALFNSPSNDTNKRKRLDSDDVQPCKIQRCLSEHLEPVSAKPIPRFRSESNLQKPTELSDHHKKKLQWAVFEALRSLNIGVSHPEFKQFASVLARVTRRILPGVTAPKSEVGTSERMLRIAKQHVFAVSKGKSVDEIVQTYEANRSTKVLKPSGYISKEMDISIARNKEKVLQDKANTMKNTDISIKFNKPENKIDRVRKIINFDDNSGLCTFK